MDMVRLFLKSAVGEKQVDHYIDKDLWVEFPARALGGILAKYEAARRASDEAGWWVCDKCEEVNIDKYQECFECGSCRT